MVYFSHLIRPDEKRKIDAFFITSIAKDVKSDYLSARPNLRVSFTDESGEIIDTNIFEPLYSYINKGRYKRSDFMLHRPDPDSLRDINLLGAYIRGASNSLFSNLAFTETGSVTISKAKKFLHYIIQATLI